jgi:hypothetical protein
VNLELNNKMMRIYLYLFLFLGFSLSTVYGQSTSCFQQLSDYSGTEFTTGQLSRLNEAACTLIDSFPSAYQDSFVVLDYGFYFHNQATASRVDEIWQEVIARADSISPYYMLLGRVPGPEGEVKVQLKMPTGMIACYDFDYNEYWRTQLISKLNYSRGFVALLEAIDYLVLEVVKVKGCCSSNFKNICASCPQDILEFRTFLESKGFLSAPLQQLTAVEKDTANGVVEELYQLNCQLSDGSTIDINQDLTTYLNAISSKVEGIRGNIAHYDPSSSLCGDVLSIVGLAPPTALQSSSSNPTKSRNNKNSLSDRYLLNMDVITTEDRWGNVEVHVRSSEDLGDLPDCDVGRINMVYIQSTNLNQDTVRNHLLDFFELLLVDHTNPYTPDIVNVGYVDLNYLRKLDAICVIGESPSRIVKYVDDNNYPHSDGFLDDWEDKNSIERGDDEKKQLAVVSMERVDEYWARVIDKHGRDKTAAFVSFHGLGHTSGRGLNHTSIYDRRGHMTHGILLERDLGSDNPDYIMTMEELIIKAKSAQPGISVNERTVAEYIRNRFVK